MIEICDYNECTGCAACANICGHSAIKMEPNAYGYVHPRIDALKCVDCGLCQRVCPNNSIPNFKFPDNAYAACVKDVTVQLTSTSGGIATLLSRNYISDGGVVYGCSGEDINSVRHIRVSTEDDIYKLVGSKYVQSSIGSAFFDIRKDLIEGKKVLFVGTPCQVAGLKSMIGPKLADNLVTVDFVCHGVPSQQILSECIRQEIGSIQNEISDINSRLFFRLKKFRTSVFSSWKYALPWNVKSIPANENFSTQYGVFLYRNKKNVIRSLFPNGDYITAFLTGLTYRESCFQCHYSRPERVSDITLGDYHFPTNASHMDGENRLLSKVIINTSKGREMWESVQEAVNKREIEYSSLLRPNSQLMCPMKPHPKLKVFREQYPIYGASILSEILKDDKARIKSHLLKNKIRDIVYLLKSKF